MAFDGQVKTLKSNKQKITPYCKGESNLKYIGLLFENNIVQKKMAQQFSVAKIKELSIQTPIVSKNILHG